MLHSRRDKFIGFLIVLPSFIAVLIFVYGFIFWTLRTSLSAWDGILPDYTFVGFDNYRYIFSTVRFQSDLWNILFFTLFFMALCWACGLLLAVFIDRGVKAEGFFRNVYLFPMSISFVVTGVAMRWIFNPSSGINSLLKLMGIPAFWGWFTDPSSFGTFRVALIPVILAASWQMSGYIMAMFLAGIRGIPIEVIEAAKMDGASEFQILRKIVMPMLTAVSLSALIVLGHISLKIFDLVYTMTGSGPAFATDVPAIFMFETTFRGNHYAEGAAISMVMLLLVTLVIVPYLSWSFKREVSR